MFMLHKTGEAETITTHYLFCIGFYRVMYMFNWIYRYLRNNPPELVAVLAGLVQAALYSDFFYIYYQRYTLIIGLTCCVEFSKEGPSSCHCEDRQRALDKFIHF